MDSNNSLSLEEKLNLRSWGLPEFVLQKYISRGIGKMFPWQVECLSANNVLNGGNLVYSAPTSAGKTLVAEIIALQTVLERRKKVIFILPFVSVVREKMLYFQDILSGSGIRVEGFMGSYNPPGGFRAVHMAICTIEKANSLINRLLEERNLVDIGCVIVDELHLLGDQQRGYLLELLLTKLKYVSQKGLCSDIQIIGMSATLPNLCLLSNWLDATLYHTEFRPIPLYEYLKIGHSIYKTPSLTLSHDLIPTCAIKNDPGDVIFLCLDTILKGFSVLIFCPTKNWCESLAVQISSEIKRLGNGNDEMGHSLRNQLNSEGISNTLELLKKCPVGLEKELGKSISFGVGYHHAGLTLDERDIIESAFRSVILRVLVATSTLSSGVNLPAKRVIIRSPAFQGRCMDILAYKQMIGRAGRMGKDTSGESYLICSEEDQVLGKQLVASELPAVESCLGHGDLSNSLKRALLEVIASGIVENSKDLEEYTKCTLLAVSVSEERLAGAIASCKSFLIKNDFIRVELDGGVHASSLAEACLSASIAPDQALHLLKELHKARQCFVLESDLHAIYEVTPYFLCDYWAVDWMKFFSIWENLPIHLQKIGELVGVEDRFLIRAMRSTINLNLSDNVYKLSVHKRFYAALALQDLINEVPLNEVANKYGCNKGMLQSLQQSSSTFAAMVTNFCRKLSWNGLEVILAQLAQRIQFGVQKELLDLLRLECMSAQLARGLHNAGITTLTELASSSFATVLHAVKNVVPFRMQSEIIEDSKDKKTVYLPGRPGLAASEVANIFIHEARSFLLKEMGVKTAEWIVAEGSPNNSVYERSTICNTEVSHNISKLTSNIKGEDTKKTLPSDSMRLQNGCSIRKENDQSTPLKPVPFGALDDTKLLDETNTADHLSVENILEKDNNLINNTHKNCFLNKSAKKESSFEGNLFKSLINKSIVQNLKEHILEGETQEIISETEDNENIVPDMLEDNNFFNDTPDDIINYIGKMKNEKVSNWLRCNEEVQPPEPSERLKNIKIDPFNFSPFKTAANLCSTYIGEKNILKNNDSMGKNEFVKDSSKFCDPTKYSSTPLGTPLSKDSANASIKDIFLESPQFKNSPLSTKVHPGLSEKNFEEFDPNWGGDSLLEMSLSLEFQPRVQSPADETGIKIVNNEAMVVSSLLPANSSGIKRKNSETENENKVKKRKFHSEIRRHKSSPSLGQQNPKKTEFFSESFEFNSEIENVFYECNKSKLQNNIDSKMVFNEKCNILDAKETCTPEKIEIKEQKEKLEEIVKSKAKPNKYISESLLKAFDGTFKFSGLEEDIHISDSEDDMVRSPEPAEDKRKLDLFSGSGNSKNGSVSDFVIKTPLKETSVSSHYEYVSPSKYPPIGGDIVQISKSPMRSKARSLSLRSLSFSPKHKNKYVNTPIKSNFDKTKVIEICKSSVSFKEFQNEILKNSKSVFYLDIRKCEDDNQKSKIGSKIIKKKDEAEIRPMYQVGGEALFGIYFYWGTEVYYFDMNTSDLEKKRFIQNLLNESTIKLFGYNMRYQLQLLYKCLQYIVTCKIFDISVADWLLYPEERCKSIRELAQEYLMTKYSDMKKTKTELKDSRIEVKLIWEIQLELSFKLKTFDILEIFENVEMPIQLNLLYLELSGIGFDHQVGSSLWSSATEMMGQLEITAYSMAKRKFNLNSNSEVKKVKAELKISVDDEFNHPLFNTVQNWRKLFSLKTRNLPQLLCNSNGRCFSKCSTNTITGRIMMCDPNLQHIPRDFCVNEKLFSPRSAFIAQNDTILVSADYAQLELRILAHYSQDPVLVPLLRKEGDIFRSIASEWHNVPLEKVTDQMRHQVKQLCYGIIYGMGDKSLGESLGKTAAEASILAAEFKRTFPKLNLFVTRCIDECRKKGYITTLAGRRRNLDEISSSVPHLRAQAERQAVNSTIQGSASDITKKAMVEIEEKLKTAFPERGPVISDNCACHLVLQLHDELIYEVKEKLLNEFVRVLKDAMENSTFISVPLPVVIKTGKSWGTLKIFE